MCHVNWSFNLSSLLVVSQHVFAVEVFAGAESVLLPCHIDFVPHVTLVLWSRRDLSQTTVHMRVGTGDELKDQNQRYHHRTSMRTDALRTGNFSLILKKPCISDSGTYICTVTNYGTEQILHQERLEFKGMSRYWHYDSTIWNSGFLSVRPQRHSSFVFLPLSTASLPANSRNGGVCGGVSAAALPVLFYM